MKPRIFIGSSRESLEYAYAIQENLENDAECTVWTQGVFGLSKNTVQELLFTLSNFDYAIFVFAPDDKVIFRGKHKTVARDNVVFELGLFCGRLGSGSVFVAAPSDIEDFHIPSDLQGVSLAPYVSSRPDGNCVAALGSACNKIRRELANLNSKDYRMVPSVVRSGFFGDFINMFAPLLSKSKQVIFYFIHSRRWRENHHDELVAFLGKTGAQLTVFLPNLKNELLIKSLQGHFNDGPAIPGLIEDAFHYFAGLKKKFPKKVNIRRFETYPTYSFYKFDDELIVAAYPTTSRRKDVPAFHVSVNHPYAEFVLEDLNELFDKRKQRILRK